MMSFLLLYQLNDSFVRQYKSSTHAQFTYVRSSRSPVPCRSSDVRRGTSRFIILFWLSVRYIGRAAVGLCRLYRLVMGVAALQLPASVYYVGFVAGCAAVSLLCGCMAVSLICWALWPYGCQSDMLGFVAVQLSMLGFVAVQLSV